jgi:DNA transformation protein and related proteins
MTISPSYLTFVVDQLSALGRVTTARMFGGVGLYCDGSIFGLIAEDILYFKVDDGSRPAYEQRGMPALRPVASKPQLVSKNYYQVPADVIEDLDTLCEWARHALSAARAKTKKTAAKKKSAKRAH